MKKKELIHAISILFNALTAGYSDEEAASELGLDLEEIHKLKSEMLDFKADELRRMPIEHVYVEYMISQMVNINDLTKMIKIYKDDPKSSNAAVGAIRTRSEIIDRIFTKGQDTGLIQKAPAKTESLFGVLIADLTDSKLNELMQQKIKELNSLVSGTEVVDITALPSPNDHLYDGPALDLNKENKDKNENKSITYKSKIIKKKKNKRTKVRKIEHN